MQKFWKKLCKLCTTIYEAVGFINENQFEFMKWSSTITAAMYFISAIRESMNQRKLASAIFIDISKAFDCVDHRILLDKLHKSGIRGSFY
jgi:hypothetical protein